jgi:hypothetical protein
MLAKQNDLQNPKGGEPTPFFSKHLEPLVLNLFYKNEPMDLLFKEIFLKHLSSRTYQTNLFTKYFLQSFHPLLRKIFLLVLKFYLKGFMKTFSS